TQSRPHLSGTNAPCVLASERPSHPATSAIPPNPPRPLSGLVPYSRAPRFRRVRRVHVSDWDRANVRGVELEYQERGSGEPVVLLHGGLLADENTPLLNEEALTD